MVEADMHVHTTASDGRTGPAAVVEEARRLGLKALAITDHDSVDGLQPALAAGAALGVRVVAGVELSTEWEEEEVHILGYFLPLADQGLRAKLEGLRAGRERRARRMVERLNELGYRLELEEVRRQAAGGALGRPHVARVLIEHGYVGSVEEAFRKLLDRGKPAYVPREKITPETAVRWLRELGALPVLAHPGLLGRDELVEQLVPAGLVGLEVYYPEHSAADIDRYLALAARFGLAVTGGSDYHGGGEGRAALGSAGVSLSLLEELAGRRRPV